MAWTRYQKFLAIMMVVTGSINTLSTKWADKMDSKNSAGEVTLFVHPFLQASAMFLGEMLCLLTFKIMFWMNRNRDNPQNTLIQGNQNFNPFILMPAAMFDLVATSIMYIGLNLTYASSFQMFRGSVIVFVALMSSIFLGRVISNHQAIGIGLVIMGLALVGLTDALYQSDEAKGRNSLITGDLLIVLAQVITACQMVYEEKYVSGLNIPALQAVGWEGVFGFSVLSLLLVVFYWVPAPPHFDSNPRGTVEDVIDGLVQIFNNSKLLVAILGTVISIAFFNFAGISVTKEMSATTRMVLDSVRTIVIWSVSIAVAWQVFHWQHLVGFAVLITGLCAYNGLLARPCVRSTPSDDETRIVVADADEE
ncbi:solute carrier family 35 member F6 [Bicyclus anynana]|uniref:Solute carrier family 35 member F6 n=1 Tax=Bicyclus anynana TaxID=110368 RepID=A0A6J1N9Q6_BICAN|nr:solute carrier family 35 member F6 [Bicyclus anynana]XP_023944466.2 solute carrier family 35 member F6 [Bicyclus anynana]